MKFLVQIDTKAVDSSYVEEFVTRWMRDKGDQSRSGQVEKIYLKSSATWLSNSTEVC